MMTNIFQFCILDRSYIHLEWSRTWSHLIGKSLARSIRDIGNSRSTNCDYHALVSITGRGASWSWMIDGGTRFRKLAVYLSLFGNAGERQRLVRNVADKPHLREIQGEKNKKKRKKEEEEDEVREAWRLLESCASRVRHRWKTIVVEKTWHDVCTTWLRVITRQWEEARSREFTLRVAVLLNGGTTTTTTNEEQRRRPRGSRERRRNEWLLAAKFDPPRRGGSRIPRDRAITYLPGRVPRDDALHPLGTRARHSAVRTYVRTYGASESSLDRGKWKRARETRGETDTRSHLRACSCVVCACVCVCVCMYTLETNRKRKGGKEKRIIKNAARKIKTDGRRRNG